MATFRKCVSATGYGEFNHISLLTHPVMQEIFGDEVVSYESAFLMSRDPDLKSVLFYRCAYGIKAHLLNMTAYAMGVFPLTYLIVNLKPTLVTARNVHISQHGLHVPVQGTIY